jgi:hypothetical protein
MLFSLSEDLVPPIAVQFLAAVAPGDGVSVQLPDADRVTRSLDQLPLQFALAEGFLHLVTIGDVQEGDDHAVEGAINC